MKVFIDPKQNAYENKEISDFLNTNISKMQEQYNCKLEETIKLSLKPKPRLLPKFIYNWLVKRLTCLEIQK